MDDAALLLFSPTTGLCQVSPHWYRSRDGDMTALALYERHYSAYHYRDGRVRRLFCGPGEKMVLLLAEGQGLFVWRKFRPRNEQLGVNCAVFRNESPLLSSMLIGEAMALAWHRWPGARLYTYVNARKIRSTNPGYCFLRAGWVPVGETAGGLRILAVRPQEAH